MAVGAWSACPPHGMVFLGVGNCGESRRGVGHCERRVPDVSCIRAVVVLCWNVGLKCLRDVSGLCLRARTARECTGPMHCVASRSVATR